MKKSLQYFTTILIGLVLILACGGGGKSSDGEVSKVDSDKDGIVDSKDQCANTPKNAKVDDKGCELDSDKDGIVDSKDQCANTPKNTNVDDKGCELDSDKDGIVDSKDQCANTPRNAKVDDKGCELDSDKDGVIDSKDQCANTPKNAKVNDKGCESDPENKTLKKESIDDAKAVVRSVDYLFDRTSSSSRSARSFTNHNNYQLRLTPAGEGKKINCKWSGYKILKDYYDDELGITLWGQDHFDCQNATYTESQEMAYNLTNGLTLWNTQQTNNESIEKRTDIHGYLNYSEEDDTESHSSGRHIIGYGKENYDSGSSYGISTEFDTPTYTIYINGYNVWDTEWKKNNSGHYIRKTAKIYLTKSNFYSITAEDSSGTEWTMLDITSETRYKPNGFSPYHVKNIINSDKTIIRKKCSQQYQMRTKIPFEIRDNDRNPFVGEMDIYNKTKNRLVKISIIDKDKIKLMSDLDNDGKLDLVKITSWDELLNTKYDICSQ